VNWRRTRRVRRLATLDAGANQDGTVKLLVTVTGDGDPLQIPLNLGAAERDHLWDVLSRARSYDAAAATVTSITRRPA
jgi:hypothetical protein